MSMIFTSRQHKKRQGRWLQAIICLERAILYLIHNRTRVTGKLNSLSFCGPRSSKNISERHEFMGNATQSTFSARIVPKKHQQRLGSRLPAASGVHASFAVGWAAISLAVFLSALKSATTSGTPARSATTKSVNQAFENRSASIIQPSYIFYIQIQTCSWGFGVLGVKVTFPV